MNSAADLRQHIGGATGKLGFLRWVEGVYPMPIAQAALQRATVVAPTGNRLGRLGRFGAMNRYGRVTRRLSGLGDTTPANGSDVFIQDVSFDPSTVATPAPVVTADSTGADGSAATPSWVQSIGAAITAATTGYLTVSQTQAQQQILQTNLQRAAAGLPPLPYTAAQLGVMGPTLNVGLSSATLTPILYLGGGIALLALLASAMKGGRRRAA